MPTYRNISGDTIGKGGYLFLPNQTLQVNRLFDDDSRLIRISDGPFYNPIIGVNKVDFSKSVSISTINDPTIALTNQDAFLNTKFYQTVSIKFDETPIIIIQSISEDIEVYLNSLANYPPIPASVGDKINLKSFRVVEKLYIVTGDQSGQCTIVKKYENDQIANGTFV